jgi:hypothetical protein
MPQVPSMTRSSLWPTADSLGQRVAQTASGWVILVGVVVVIGWLLNIPLLTGVISGGSTMKVNTAVCFVLSGVSLGLQIQSRVNLRRVAKGCAIAVGTVALLTLCQYLFSWNLGIDQLLFRDLSTASTQFPGRMGENTALCFALVSLALWLREYKTERIDALVQTATVCAAAIALLALAGHAYSVQGFHSFIFYSTSMAIHTALTFLVLCGGILASRTDYRLWEILTGKLIGSTVARWLLPVAIAAPFALGWLIL